MILKLSDVGEPVIARLGAWILEPDPTYLSPGKTAF